MNITKILRYITIIILIGLLSLETILFLNTNSDDAIKLIIGVGLTIAFLIYFLFELKKSETNWNRILSVFLMLCTIIGWLIAYTVIYISGPSDMLLMILITIFAVILLVTRILELKKQMKPLQTLKKFGKTILTLIVFFLCLFFAFSIFLNITIIYKTSLENDYYFIFGFLSITILGIILYLFLRTFIHLISKKIDKQNSFKEYTIKNRFILIISAIFLPAIVIFSAGAEGYSGLFVILIISLIISLITITLGITGIVLKMKKKG